MGQKRTLNDFFASGTSYEAVSVVKHLKTTTSPVSPPPLRRTAIVNNDRNATALKSAPESGRKDEASEEENTNFSNGSSSHSSYPHPISSLPTSLSSDLSFCPYAPGRSIIDEPNKLDLLYFEPYIPASTSSELFRFLRRELPFYRVQYSIKRGTVETQITTPRYTSVFGIDETCLFLPLDPPATAGAGAGAGATKSIEETAIIADSRTRRPVPRDTYKCTPRPIPACLARLQELVEASTDTSYNFILVNYYATGADSISYHSDDERFLGPNPAIASLSLGAERDFYMKPKAPSKPPEQRRQIEPGRKAPQTKNEDVRKFKLSSGNMVLMRGGTQANWLHSIPKRSNAGGRINITFRKALVKGGTENYYRYNVLGDSVRGEAQVFRWSEQANEMKPWRRSQ